MVVLSFWVGMVSERSGHSVLKRLHQVTWNVRARAVNPRRSVWIRWVQVFSNIKGIPRSNVSINLSTKWSLSYFCFPKTQKKSREAYCSGFVLYDGEEVLITDDGQFLQSHYDYDKCKICSTRGNYIWVKNHWQLYFITTKRRLRR